MALQSDITVCHLETDRISALATVLALKLRKMPVSAWFRFRLTKFQPSYGYGRNRHKVSAVCWKCTLSVTFRLLCRGATALRVACQ